MGGAVYMSNLKLPKKDRPVGLYLHCNKHKRWYANDSVVKCKCDLVYKYKIHIPNKEGKCKTRNLDAKTLEEALIECRAYKRELLNNSFQDVAIKKVNPTPIYLLECIAAYVDYLNNIDVPFHNRKEREPRTIRDYERALEYFTYALKENNINAATLKFTDINEDMVGYACQYGLETRKMRHKTYNSYTSYLKSFATYIIKKYNINIRNPFDGVQKKLVIPIVKSISLKEFNELLKIVGYENGWVIEKDGKRKNQYRPWLKDAYRLGLFTGGRREEVVKLQWNGIKLKENGEIAYIQVNHFKINRANSSAVSDSEFATKKFTVNKDFFNLLVKLGYEKYKHTDRFILAPDETATRKTMMALITSSFSHYFKQLKTGEAKNFKHLRKTYITAQYLKYGENTHKETFHEDMAVLHKHYIDDNVVMEAKQEETKNFGKLLEDE